MHPGSPFRWFPSFNIFVWCDETFSGSEDTDRPERYPVTLHVAAPNSPAPRQTLPAEHCRYGTKRGPSRGGGYVSLKLF